MSISRASLGKILKFLEDFILNVEAEKHTYGIDIFPYEREVYTIDPELLNMYKERALEILNCLVNGKEVE